MNDNCLEGFDCPFCGHAENFNIEATCYIDVRDEGTGDHEDVTWDDDSACACGGCGAEGLVRDFQLPPFVQDNLHNFIVNYREADDGDDDDCLSFDCLAEDHEHAKDQMLNAYPDAFFLRAFRLPPTDDQYRAAVGDRVWWRDPEQDFSTAIHAVKLVTGDDDDSMVVLDGGTEVFACELIPLKQAAL